MADRVVTLSLAWYFTDDEKYAAKAAEFLRAWFLDEDTRMNPNLEYAQMVPGVNGGKGRSYGVLDAYSFVEMLDAVALLEQSDSFTVQDSQRLKAWFSDLLDWMLTSTQGVEESAMPTIMEQHTMHRRLPSPYTLEGRTSPQTHRGISAEAYVPPDRT